jgi:hypothetical protein
MAASPVLATYSRRTGALLGSGARDRFVRRAGTIVARQKACNQACVAVTPPFAHTAEELLAMGSLLCNGVLAVYGVAAPPAFEGCRLTSRKVKHLLQNESENAAI